MQLLLYLAFTALFLFISFLFVKLNNSWKGFNFFIVVHTIILLFSAIWHTSQYGVKTFKAQIDQENFYYPYEVPSRYVTLEEKTYGQLAKDLINCYRNYRHSSTNISYFLFYKIFRNSIFTKSYFFCGYYFVSLLNATLHLFSLLLFVKILTALSVSNKFKWLGFFIISQPFLIARDAMPLANAFTCFALLFYLFVLLKYFKRTTLNLFALFLLYASHKIFYVCVPPLLFFYLLVRYPYKRKLMFGICLGILSYFCFMTQTKDTLVYWKGVAERAKLGNSYIPRCTLLYRVFNAWYAPLLTNSKILFYKTPNGNSLGWAYAIFVNFIYIILSAAILKRLRYFKKLESAKRSYTLFLLLFIALLSISFCGTYNYLTLNRHNTNVIYLWVVLLAALQKTKQGKESEIHG